MADLSEFNLTPLVCPRCGGNTPFKYGQTSVTATTDAYRTIARHESWRDAPYGILLDESAVGFVVNGVYEITKADRPVHRERLFRAPAGTPFVAKWHRGCRAPLAGKFGSTDLREGD